MTRRGSPRTPASTVARHPPDGFTLIEVLVALVIVGLGMMGVIQAVIQSVNSGTYLREKTLAHWIAMNLLTERRLQTAPPEIGTSSDELQYAGERWRWTVRVSETAVETMRRFDISVRHADAPEDDTLATAIGFYGTAIAPAGTAVVNWNGSGTTRRPDGQAGDGGTNPPQNPATEPQDDSQPDLDEDQPGTEEDQEQ
jgi:type II secretion system protein I